MKSALIIANDIEFTDGASNDAFHYNKFFKNTGCDCINLINKSATISNVTTEIMKLAKNANQGDIIYIIYSGHGTTNGNQNLKLYDEYLTDIELRNMLCEFAPDIKLITIIDCCFSENITDECPHGCNLNGITKSEANISACKGNELALEAILGNQWRGVFSYWLMYVLKQAYNDRNLTITDLQERMKAHLPSKRYSQTPDFTFSNKDMLIF